MRIASLIIPALRVDALGRRDRDIPVSCALEEQSRLEQALIQEGIYCAVVVKIGMRGGVGDFVNNGVGEAHRDTYSVPAVPKFLPIDPGKTDVAHPLRQQVLPEIVLYHLSGMAAAAVFAAAMVIAVRVIMLVMAACEIKIAHKNSVQIVPHYLIHASNRAGNDLDPTAAQGILCALTDPAADQHIHLIVPQEACQRGMAISACIQQSLGLDLLPLCLIYRKGLCLSKMLENGPIFRCHCNFHFKNLFPAFIRE